MPVEDGFTVGVDLGATKVSTLLMDRRGEVRRSDRCPTSAGSGPQAVLEVVEASIHRVAGSEPIRAMGVGVAAQVDRDGIVRFAPNLRWSDLPLGPSLARDFGVPVHVLNDVRAATVGEWRRGVALGQTDLVCLFLGTGLGGGVVSGGRLLVGATNAAGELGHLTIVAGGRRCTCPSSGCLEAYVGGWAIADRAREAARADPPTAARWETSSGEPVDRLTAETVVRLAREGDPVASRVLTATQEYLTAGLVGIANAFNPRMIVSGGGVFAGAPALFDSALEAARPLMLPSVAEGLRGARAALGADSVAIGAAVWARQGNA